MELMTEKAESALPKLYFGTMGLKMYDSNSFVL